MGACLYMICAAVLAVLGRIFGQFLAARKELDNRNRQLRMDLLVDAWRSIELAANRTDQEAMSGLERALGDIQLLGTPSQVERASRVAYAMAGGSHNPSVLVDLLEVLRGDLRREMRLSALATPLGFLLEGLTSGSQSQVVVSLAKARHRRVVETEMGGGSSFGRRRPCSSGAPAPEDTNSSARTGAPCGETLPRLVAS
jgi:hypothetical protein